MLVLGSISYVPKEPCPSVSSPKRVSLLSLGGFGSRCLQGYLGAQGHGPPITVAMRCQGACSAHCRVCGQCVDRTAQVEWRGWKASSEMNVAPSGCSPRDQLEQVGCFGLSCEQCKFGEEINPILTGPVDWIRLNFPADFKRLRQFGPWPPEYQGGWISYYILRNP